MKKQYLLGIMMAIAVCSWAQKDAKMQADQAYDQLSYLKAADLYQQLGESGLDAMAKVKLADSYRLNGDTESAEYWYAQAISETSAPEDILHYAQILQSNGKCETALNWYDKYQILMGDNHPLPRAKVTDCSKMLFSRKEAIVVNNAKALNSGHLDYSPIPYKGGIVFTSTRGKKGDLLEDQWTKDNFSDLFFAKKIDNKEFGEIKILEGTVNSSLHDGTATFNKTGTIMYFSRNNNGGKNNKNIVDLKIYSAELNNKKWGNVKELPFNNPEYSTCHPSLSADGSTIYFASNRPGGFGGMDLYKTTRSGTYWSVPENLGETVNTAGNEIFPFIDKSGILYFASDGLEGIGGLDIYQTQQLNGNWTVAENLGAPINSAKDDFGYCRLENGEEGYFASNRIGGYGGDDIYFWTGGEAPMMVTQNVITVVDELSGSKIENATVTVIEGIFKNKSDIPAAVPVKNRGAVPSEYQAKPVSFLTDIKGNIEPSIRSGKTYTILVEKTGYTPVKKVIKSYEMLSKPALIIPMKTRNGLALKGSVIQKDYNKVIPNVALELFNLCTGEYESTITDDTGNFEFFLDCDCDYELTAKKERFTIDKKKYSTTGTNCETAKPIDDVLYLNIKKETPTPKPITSTPTTVPVVSETTPILNKEIPAEEIKVGQVITLDNVYYDFNKATIRGDASEALDNVVNLLKTYPSMTIELYSHTDARGDRVYNEALSQRRAESAVAYITAKGIDPNRLIGKGYGEWLLKNHCEDGVNCSEYEHQQNRRTEIKITKLEKEVEVRYRNE